MTKYILAILTSVLIGGTALADTPVDRDHYRDVAMKALAEKGVKAEHIDRIAVEPNFGDRDSVLESVVATAYLENCSLGYAVVWMNSSGIVKNAYTRDGCKAGMLEMN